MTTKILKICSSLILLGFLVIGLIVLIPVDYKVEPLAKRNNTQYWQLKTGSKIGYFKIEAKSPQKKNPIIYLHGGPGGKVKDDIIETLRPLASLGHDLYFYDQVGSGHSNRLDDISEYSVKRHQEDLNEIIAKTQSEQVILIAQSWGACLAINYLQDFSEKVEKIILTGPGPILPINRKMETINPPDSLSLIEPAFSNKQGNEKVYTWRSRLILKWAYLFNAKLAGDQEVDQFFAILNQELVKSTTCKGISHNKSEGGLGYYNHIMTVKSFPEVDDKRSRLKKIDIPILILRGQCDNQKWGFTKEYLDLFSNSKLEIIKGVGHNLIHGGKEEYYELIEQFLREN
jgi:proline iminopeptidase